MCVHCNGLVSIFVCSCASLDHFGFVFSRLVLLSLFFFSSDYSTDCLFSFLMGVDMFTMERQCS